MTFFATRTPDAQRDLFNLRVLLVVSALGWGMSFVAALAPWSLVVRWIEAIGRLTPPDHPMIQYWVRMAGAGFGFIGLFYLRLALRPAKHLHWMAVTRGSGQTCHEVCYGLLRRWCPNK